MDLPKGSGLEQLSRALSPGIKRLKAAIEDSGLLTAKPVKNHTYKKHAAASRIQPKPLPSFNPVQDLVKGMTTMLSKITRGPETEDYSTVVKEFVPDDARFVKPQNPQGSDSWLMADLDGDSRHELVATYRHAGGLKTLILKKKDGRWYKAAEIAHPEHDRLDYRSISDIGGDGKMQLLLGMSAKGRSNNTIDGYALGENTAKKLFSRNYNWVELTRQAKGANTKQRSRLAVWNRDENGMYDIEVLGWNGLQLVHTADTSDYYYNRVAPYYYRKLRQQPDSVHGWYKLADSLKRGEAYHDALRVAEAGIRLKDQPEYKEKFSSLKEEITDLML